VGQKISPNAAAEELGISLRQVRRLISSGELRAYRVGKCSIIRIDTDDLAALLKPVVSEAVRVDPVSDRLATTPAIARGGRSVSYSSGESRSLRRRPRLRGPDGLAGRQRP